MIDNFIDNKITRALGVSEANIDEAIFDSIHVSVACHNGDAKLLGMKGELSEEERALYPDA